MSDYPDNPGPLPASKLCNKNPPYNPIQGEGALGNQYSGRMFYRGGDKEELVRTLQEMLTTLGYNIGTAGIDGKFGDNTEKAVRQFQEENKDWEGNKLKVDGLVGPRTSDALNRAMVGVWYDHYQTPKELVEGKPYHTVTSDFLANGLSIEPGMAQEAKVFLIGEIPKKALEHTLVIRLIDVFGKPVKKASYSLEIADPNFERVTGVTDEEGILSHRIPGKAKTGKLILDTHIFDLIIEDFEPAGTVKGALVRLSNLGYLAGHPEEVQSMWDDEQEKGEGQMFEQLRLALIRFQNANDLDTRGKLDESTSKKLEVIYGG